MTTMNLTKQGDHGWAIKDLNLMLVQTWEKEWMLMWRCNDDTAIEWVEDHGLYHQPFQTRRELLEIVSGILENEGIPEALKIDTKLRHRTVDGVSRYETADGMWHVTRVVAKPGERPMWEGYYQGDILRFCGETFAIDYTLTAVASRIWNAERNATANRREFELQKTA